MSKEVKMTYTVTVPLGIMIDEESLIKDFDGNIERVARMLFEEEGFWWDVDMKLEKAEIVEASNDH